MLSISGLSDDTGGELTFDPPGGGGSTSSSSGGSDWVGWLGKLVGGIASGYGQQPPGYPPGYMPPGYQPSFFSNPLNIALVAGGGLLAVYLLTK